MAFQTPTISSRHVLRAAGSANVTTSVAAAVGFPVTRLFDDQTRRLFKFSTDAVNHFVTVDQSAAPLAIDNLTIPAGHNLDGIQIEIRSVAALPFSPGTLRQTFTPSGTGVISRDFGSFTDNFIRIVFLTTGEHEFGELVLTQRRSLALGPNPRFVDTVQPNFGQTRMLSGEVFRNVRGSAQRMIRIEWDRLDATAQAILDDIASETLDGVLPVWLESPYDNLLRIPVRIVSGLRREQDSPNPTGTGIEERLVLEMREALE